MMLGIWGVGGVGHIEVPRSPSVPCAFNMMWGVWGCMMLGIWGVGGVGHHYVMYVGLWGLCVCHHLLWRYTHN